MNDLFQCAQHWAPVIELSRMLSEERRGLDINSSRLRNLAESLKAHHPEIKVTLASITSRLA